MTPSPEKRRYDVLAGYPPSPIISKRQRVASGMSTGPSAPPTVPSHNVLSDNSHSDLYAFQDTENDSTEPNVVPLDVTDATTITDSISAMIEETHANRLALREEMTAGKGTENAYPRHIKNYEKFMLSDQAARQQKNPLWKMVPAHPITATKVATFLQHETTREKQTSSGQDLSGTHLAPQSIKQCISALENYRYHHKGSDPRYKDDPEAQKTLRDDERITTYERNAFATESKRLEESQELKAQGVTADTYEEDDLLQGSMWCLQSLRGSRQQVHIGIRDRAMLLISATTAYRGNNIRGLLLSDLAIRDILMVDIGLDAKAMALVLLSNQGKTNVTGRIDEQAAVRHRKAELCPIGALGLYLFSSYHILEKERPRFASDYSDPRGHGEIGYREWYRMFLFPGSGGDTTEMTYENHRKRVNLMHLKNEILIKKVTHAGRPYAAMTARERRATTEDTKALGNWKKREGAFGACYDRVLPIDAMLAAASFNGRKQESFFVARDVLEPPTHLCNSIFPWVEEEQVALKQRCNSLGIPKAGDVTLLHFLALLQRLRPVILQDAAVLSQKYPDCPLFHHAPFNIPAFIDFASSSIASIKLAEDEARNQLAALPETLAGSIRGIVTSGHLQQEQLRTEFRRETSRFTNQLEAIDLTLCAYAMGSTSQRQKAVTALTAYPSPNQSTIVSQAASNPCFSTTLNVLPASLLGTSSCTTVDAAAAFMSPPANTLSESLMTISLSGKSYPSTTFPLSSNPSERDKQLAFIDVLESKLSADRMSKHQFQWIRSSSESLGDEWRPIYFYWKPAEKNASPTVEEIWKEFAFGMNGHLSVSELNSGWNARWRGSGAARTETSCRKKIITLIETLAAKPNWNSELALRFLKVQYPIPTPSVPHLKTTRAFIDRLQKPDGQLMREIIEAANMYTAS